MKRNEQDEIPLLDPAEWGLDWQLMLSDYYACMRVGEQVYIRTADHGWPPACLPILCLVEKQPDGVCKVIREEEE